MNTDGNTAAIERMLDEREEHDERQDTEQEIADLRDEVDALVAKLAEVEAERDACMDDLEQALGQRDDAAAVAHRAETRIAHLESHIEAVAKDTHKIMVAYYDAALPAVYRLGLAAGAKLAETHFVDAGVTGQREHTAGQIIAAAIRATSTPTAAELIARINEGEKE